MTLGKGYTIVFLSCMIYLLSACPGPVEYPEEPEIKFDDFYTDAANPDVGYLSIAFTDGDGDIGLTESMDQPPYDTNSYYHFNMYARYFEYNTNTQQWQPSVIAGDTTVFTFRVPDITPEGKNKALKGTIQVRIEPFYKNPNSPFDSIKYKIQLIDRALHKSNWIETPVIYKGAPL